MLCFGCLLMSGMTCKASSEQSIRKSAYKVSGGSWVSNKSGIRYQKSDGTFVRAAWIRVSDSVYRIGKDGYVLIGWFSYHGNWYYADSEGKIYYNRWLVKHKRKYYFDKTGACVRESWKQIGDEYYYFNEKGVMQTNSLIGRWYVDDSGARVSSQLVYFNEKYYYFGKNGKYIRNKWRRINGRYCYFNSNGTMAVNQWIDCKYYVGSDGTKVRDCVVDGFYINSSGVRTKNVFSGKYIFVGDSRTVGLRKANPDENTLFIAKGSQGYSWLKSTAGPLLRAHLRKDPDVKVVLALGVNDLENIAFYIEYYAKLMQDFPDTEFYFLSVNIVDREKLAEVGKHHSATNAKIREFNQNMKRVFGEKYINCYRYLETYGFETRDGVHYTETTNQRIYRFVMKKIG